MTFLRRPQIHLCALLALQLLLPVSVAAQQGVTSLQGVVRNETGRPVEQAQILLDPGGGQRELRTDRDGAFRFVGVAPGEHRLRVMRIGFQMRDTSVVVGAGSQTDVVISLNRLTSLSEVTVRAAAMGVYGVVLERDSLKPIDGAHIELLGARAGDTTDATGAFAMGNARPGTYMLRVSHPMFDTRMLSVRVPPDSGIGIDIVLKPGRMPLPNSLEFGLKDMAQRIQWVTGGGNAAIVGRDELRNHGSALEMALKFAPNVMRRGLVIDEKACLFIDGVARPLVTVSAIDADQIETIEIYGSRGDITGTLAKMWPRGAICGNPSARSAPGNRAQFVSIWMRR